MGTPAAWAIRFASSLPPMAASGREWDEAEAETFRAGLRDQYETQGHPYYATARLWDDGVIDPLDTRLTLALAISAAYNAPIPEPSYGVFRM